MPNKGKFHADRCCNPHQTTGHKGRNLRNLSTNLKRKFPEIDLNAKICSDCRKKSNGPSYSELSDTSENSSDISQMNVDIDQNVSAEVNVTSSRSNPVDVRSERETELEDLLNDLKEKFKALPKYDPMRLKILIITPKSWSANKISKEFDCSWQLANKAKNLRDSKGIL